MNIVVVGTGYVGLVTGTCFAETGNSVVCVDIDQSKVDRLRQGEIPIYEPGLETIFHRNVDAGRLTFTTDIADCIDDAQILFLALPTPPGEDGSADLSYVMKAADHFGPMIKDYKVIVDKSTVPVGTAGKVADVLKKHISEDLFDVVSNPEFLREGVAVEDFLKPDRVVVGTSSDRARDIMEELYKPFVRQGNPIIFMDEASAEMTKYAANSFLATKISFMNEIANLCERVGADVDMVRLGIGSDTRIGKRFLFPGVGYGGSCFPKDVKALFYTSKENSYDFQILDSVMQINQLQRERFFEKIKANAPGGLKGKTIALWGLAFKPNTDDIREAPALYLIEQLLAEGAQIRAFDPEAADNVKAVFGDKIHYAKGQYDAVEGADFLVIVTEWSVFRTPDFKKIKEMLTEPLIFDGRNLYEVDHMKELGFSYLSIGREQVKQS